MYLQQGDALASRWTLIGSHQTQRVYAGVYPVWWLFTASASVGGVQYALITLTAGNCTCMYTAWATTKG